MGDSGDHVVLVDPDGRLGSVATTLSSSTPAFTCTRVETPADVSTAEDPDAVIVPEAPATAEYAAIDGIEQYRAVDTVSDGVPIGVYVVSTHEEFVGEALQSGVDTVLSAPPSESTLLAHRVGALCDPSTLSPDRAQMLDSMMESFPHQFFFKDTHGQFLEVSRVAAEAFGFDRETMVGLSDFCLFSEEVAQRLHDDEQRIIETQEPMVENVEHFVEDGQDKWTSTTKAPWYDDDGTVVGIVGSTREVSPQQRREQLVQALHESSQDLLRAGTKREVASITAAIVGEKNTFPAARIALVEEGQLQPVAGTEQARPYDEHAGLYDRALRTGTTQYHCSDGETVTAFPASSRVAAAFVPLDDHGVVGFVPTQGDISAAHEELIPVLTRHVTAALDGIDRERLAHQKAQLEEFASVVSHDLRSPLSVAGGHADLLAESVDSPHVDSLQASLERMERLIDDLLELSRKGQTVGETAAVDLCTVAERAWEHVDTPTAGFVCTSTRTVEADERRLMELFENLFRNAVEHNSDPVTVRVEPTSEGFAVADDGTGLATAEADRLFEMGYSSDADGTGYGLSIVASIAEAHGWTVTPGTSDEGGARFEFDVDS